MRYAAFLGPSVTFLSENFRAEQQCGNTFFLEDCDFFFFYAVVPYNSCSSKADSSLMAGPISH